MVDVPLSRRSVDRGGVLRLPVEQFSAQGVVAIHGGGRVVGFCLAQGYEEGVGVHSRGPYDACDEDGGLVTEVSVVESRQDLLAAVVGMRVESAVTGALE